MYVYLSKILPILLMPLTLMIALQVLAFLALLAGRKALSKWMAVLSLVFISTASLPIFAATLYRSLEARFPAIPIEQLPSGQCIVLLGGALGLPQEPRKLVELNEAVDRVYVAAQLYSAKKGSYIVVTGGNQPWAEAGPSEAALVGDLLKEWGVPTEALYLEGRSRNTRENAVNTKPILEKLKCDNPLLVTSAAHMPRAVAAFQVLGIDAIPVSTDIRVVDSGKLVVMDFFPDAHALAMTSDAIREYMGLVVYKIRGWN